MSYPDDLSKHRFSKWLQAVPEMHIAEELAYVLTRIVIEYARKLGPSFVAYTQIVGIVDAVRDEFKRRVIDPYEDKKRRQNGDVYAALFEHFGDDDDQPAA